MNRALWILQVVFGIYFVAIGILHFIVPDGLPSPMIWMYDMSTGLHIVAGTLEILGGVGLIVPAALRILPFLTPLAGAGLALLMIAAAAWHGQQEQFSNIPQNLIVAALLAFITYGRWKIAPLAGQPTVQR